MVCVLTSPPKLTLPLIVLSKLIHKKHHCVKRSVIFVSDFSRIVNDTLHFVWNLEKQQHMSTIFSTNDNDQVRTFYSHNPTVSVASRLVFLMHLFTCNFCPLPILVDCFSLQTLAKLSIHQSCACLVIHIGFQTVPHRKVWHNKICDKRNAVLIYQSSKNNHPEMQMVRSHL